MKPIRTTQAEYAAEFGGRDPLHIDVFDMPAREYRQRARLLIEHGTSLAEGREFAGVMLITDAPKPVLAFTWARPKLIH